MYQKLLITEGGGIVPVGQTSEQSTTSTNIFIGLGGTGKSCLKTIKKDIYTRLQSDDPQSAIKTYKNAYFLCIDSDVSGVDSGVGALAPQEFYNIGCKNIGSFLSSETLLTDPAYTWLKSIATEPEGQAINVDDTKSGACGVRQAGRALLFQHAAVLLEKITTVVKEARTAMPGATVKIHLFTGIGGGTGAGTFLDICYLIRKMIADQQWGDAQVFGYFFLPDVNLSNPKLDTAAREAIMCTGYASMKELDYCMNFANNGDQWEQFYGGFEIRSKEKPVDYAVLVTATDANGITQPNPYRYAMNVVSTFVMDFLVKQEGESTIDSVISNFPTLISHSKKTHGANHAYLVLGASCTYMPFADITTYLTSKIFAKFAKINETYPTDNDVNVFIKENKLDYDAILRDLRTGVGAVRPYAVEIPLLYDQALACSTSAQYPSVLDKMYKDDLSRIAGGLETNKRALLEKLDRKAVLATGTAHSLINRIFAKLIGFATDYEKGPFYAAAFLHTVKAKDIKNAIDGMIAENSRRLSLAMTNMNQKDDDYGVALNNFKNSNVLNRKKKGNQLIDAFRNYCVMDAEVKTLQTMNEILTTLKKQVEELYSEYFSKMETVLRELQNTFTANANAFDSNEFTTDEFAVKILSINDVELKKSLDAELEAMKIGDIFSNFMTCLANDDEWISQNEDKIVSIINAHFVSELEEHCQKSTETYLGVKFGTTNPDELQTNIYKNIVLPVSSSAAPLFWQSPNYQLANASSIAYCYVPQGAPLIVSAVKQYQAGLPIGSKFEIIAGNDPGRISFLELRCGIPFFGYQGLNNYKSAPSHTGRYIYEISSRDARTKGMEYDIIPLSCIPESDKNDSTKTKISMLEKAKAYGIFASRDRGTETGKNFFINTLDAAAIDEMVTTIGQLVEGKNMDKLKVMLSGILPEDAMKTALAKLDSKEAADVFFSGDFDTTLKTSYAIAAERFVPSIGTAGYEDRCADDVVFSYKSLYETLVANTELAEKRYNAIRGALTAMANLLTQSGMVQSFVTALCCNVIEVPDNYTFKCNIQNKFGLTDTVELTTIDSTPYGEHLPLYSAFLAYSAFEADVLDAIKASARAKKVSAPDEVEAATAKIKLMFSDEKNINSSAKILARARTSFALKFDEIHQFANEFAAELANI